MRKHKPNDVWKDIKKGAPDECWPWTGCIGSGGYGSFMMWCRSYVPHRIVYALTHPGEIEFRVKEKSAVALYVLHTCDNRLCCNPSHLKLGTQKENMRDMIAKKRGPDMRGELNPRAKLRKENVEDIRWLHSNGFARQKLARIYEVSWTCIDGIISGRTWLA